LTLRERPVRDHRKTHRHHRGEYLSAKEEVKPAIPKVFGQLDSDSPANRLSLAHWLVSDDNPLAGRVTVNRGWRAFFGTGIVRTAGDFGTQSEPPTHPELLDWLAADFQSDWDVKRLVKSIVMTDAYQRSSVADKKTVQVDPGNLWYARQGRWRIDAEFVRDTALQLSDLLQQSQIGGRSVKPYQPAGYWQHLNFPKRKWKQDSGQKLYRKSLYTFWCRSFCIQQCLPLTRRRVRNVLPVELVPIFRSKHWCC
jgi:hypothetical protein